MPRLTNAHVPPRQFRLMWGVGTSTWLVLAPVGSVMSICDEFVRALFVAAVPLLDRTEGAYPQPPPSACADIDH